MSRGHSILIVSLFMIFQHAVVLQLRAEDGGEIQTAADRWPPPWLEGIWENRSTTITCNGQPANKSFSTAEYYIFYSGYRFSVYSGRRVSATPMLGHTRREDTLYCLFKMTNERAAMQTEFTGDADNAQYISFLHSTSDGKKYKFTRELVRVSDDQKAFRTVKSTYESNFYTPHTTAAEPIFTRWFEDQLRSLQEASRSAEERPQQTQRPN